MKMNCKEKFVKLMWIYFREFEKKKNQNGLTIGRPLLYTLLSAKIDFQ